MSNAATKDWLSAVKAQIGREALPPQTAVDPVNLPTIRRWCEAMGERNPQYTQGGIAPPATLFMWTMSHFRSDLTRAGGSMLGLDLVDAAGFTSVVATNVEEEYCRDLRCGDVITQRVTLDAISEEKNTGLGVGHFVTFRYEFTDQKGELVGRTLFRVLKFRPPAKSAAAQGPLVPRPPVTPDSAFFWEGLNQHKLLVRQCGGCGRLHHPPGPMCPACNSLEWRALECSGRGTIHSFVVVHQPQMPGLKYPLPVALIDLEEGARVVANLQGIAAEQARIGMPVEVDYVEIEKDFVLPVFHERRAG
ncbi:MAG: bifunctional MaoC family dehydratase N-terminal/OB-fold nucleic acid binding domain-containing protein [Steroidobacteraceae bacterium]